MKKTYEISNKVNKNVFYVKAKTEQDALLCAIPHFKNSTATKNITVDNILINETHKVFIDDVTSMMPRAKYKVDVSWKDIETYLNNLAKDLDLQLEPDFQRNHVWTQKQQIAYIEYIMRQGLSGRDIYFNCASWNNFKHEDKSIVLVDGLQRLTAVRKFMNNEFAVFDNKFVNDFCFIDILNCAFKVNINDLQTKKEVLQWYLDFNSAGTQHTQEELDRVAELLRKENDKE